ncbi:MAG TPA: ATP-binding protein [Pseudorhodoferax sp.]|nr:ATP-binding protein [Pseudorhodoferax sp.]
MDDTSVSEHLAAPRATVAAPRAGAAFTQADRAHGRTVMMRTVIGSMPRSFLSAVLGALIMSLIVDDAVVQQGGQGRWVVWTWWSVLAVASAWGAWIALRFQRGPRDTDSVHATSRRLIRNGAVCAVGWGAASWLLLPAANQQVQTTVLISTTIVIWGGGAVQAIHRTYVRTFILVTVTVFASGLLRLGDLFDVVFGLIFALTGFVVITFAADQERAVLDTILLGLRAERLLAEANAQRQQAESARAQADQARQQAELANHAKNTFLAAAGHDLRQPMHALVQYLGVLRRNNRDASLHDTIARLGMSLDAMQDLLDAVLEVSRLMLGTVQPKPGVHRIAGILDRVDAQMRPMAQDKGLTLTTLTTLAPPDVAVFSDDVLLERMLRNLVLNAVRYTAQGQVTVRARRRGAAVVVQVFDTGIGIPRQERPRIFEPFYQVGNQARDRHKGMGLGLAIVAQLGELLQVPVRVRSRPGRGSVFTLSLQPAHPQHGDAGLPAEQAPAGDYLRDAFVVLIDDNAESLEATATTLCAFGCQVLQARSGADAVARLRAQALAPQIVVCDYRLEDGETGPQAIALVIDDQRLLWGERFAICALVLSGETAPAELAQVRQAGLALLHKPVKPEALYQAVQMQLRALALDDRGYEPPRRTG